MKDKNVILSWEDLSIIAASKPIINKENGEICEKSLVAIIGTSGAGKTSFLNALAGRVPKNIEIHGKILLFNEDRHYKSWLKNVAYVEQEFHSYKQQTVYETLYFSSILRNSHINADENVKKTMNDLDLQNIKDSKLKDISGGELKRVAIGTELVCDPEIFFLDEPTSGLDSFSAQKLVINLEKLAERKTLLMTVHQPSYMMSQSFTEIMIMSRGDIIFRGKTNDCITFFSDSGYKLPKNINPYDYFMEVIALNPNDEKLRRKFEIEKTPKVCFASNIEIYQNDVLKEYNEDTNDSIVHTNIIHAQNSWFFTFSMLLKRNFSEYSRDSKYLKIQIIQKFIFLLLIGLPYLQLGYSTYSIQSRTGVIFFLLINSLFGTTGPILNIFPHEKKIIERERKTGFYDGVTAYLSKYISTIIFDLIYTFLYVAAVYWMVGLNPNVGRFFLFIMIILSAILFSVALGLTIGTFSPTEKFSQVLGTTVLLFFIIFGGGFANPKSIPNWLRWIIWISPVNYAFRALMLNQYLGLEFEDLSGEEILKEYNLSTPGFYANSFGLWGLTAICIIVGSISLHFLTRIKLNLIN